MKITVVVPVYNVEKYIEKCLMSIKNQSFNDYECLIINDGTKDNSIDIAQKIIQGDERFKIINKENGGLSDTKNLGIKLAKGDYICFVDSDDYIDEKMLEKAYKMAVKHDSDITCFDLYYEYDNGNKKISIGAYKEVSSYQEDYELLYINNSSNNKLYKTSFIKDKSFIKGMWYEDLAVIPIWIAKANNVSYVNEPLYHYLQRDGSISHSADPRIFDIYKAIDNIKKTLSLDNEKIKKLYYNNCLIMTTLRIKEFSNKQNRLDYYSKNIDLLTKYYPEWYKDLNKSNYSFKQNISFFLLKHRQFKILDTLYK